MQFVFPSPVTRVKSHENKCQNYFCVTKITANDMMKCGRNVNFEEMDTERSTVQQEKVMDFDY